MHQTDGRSMSEWKENTAKSISSARLTARPCAAGIVYRIRGFNRLQKRGIFRLNPGSSGECRLMSQDNVFSFDLGR